MIATKIVVVPTNDGHARREFVDVDFSVEASSLIHGALLRIKDERGWEVAVYAPGAWASVIIENGKNIIPNSAL